MLNHKPINPKTTPNRAIDRSRQGPRTKRGNRNMLKMSASRAINLKAKKRMEANQGSLVSLLLRKTNLITIKQTERKYS